MIKFFFFLIAIANLIFFLWELQYAAVTKTAQNPTVKQTSTEILLVSEAPATAQQLNTEAKPKQNSAFPADSNPASESIESAHAGATEKPAVLSEKTASIPSEPDDNTTDTHTSQTIAESKHDMAPPDSLKPAEFDHTADADETDPAPEKTARIPFSATDEITLRQTAETVAQSETEQHISAPANTDLPSQTVAPALPETATPIAEKTAQATTELDPEKTPDTRSETVTESKPESVTSLCLETQTFASKQAALDALPPYLDALNIYETEQNIPSTYLVFIPAAKDFDTAKATEQQLKAKGITNLWLFRKGPMKNAISLGLFVKKYRAENLARQLKQKQIEVEIQTRYKTIKRWRIDTNQADCTQQPD